MPDRRLFSLLLVLSILAALTVRLPNLSRRPMHTDEAVHAIKTGDLLQGQSFQYDPRDYHGPTLHYSAWLNARLHGADDVKTLQVQHLRLITVLYGSMLIVWLLALFGYWHPLGLLASAALFIISPSLVYYSKYFIMEILLLFFHLGFTIAIVRYLIHPSTRWMVIGSVCLGLMFATKETTPLFVAAAGLAVVIAIGFTPDRRQIYDELRKAIPTWHLPVTVLIAAIVFAVLISSFGTNLANIGAYMSSYRPYFQNGFGDPIHAKPWFYYGKMLLFSQFGEGPVWSEVLVLLLGSVGAYSLFTNRIFPCFLDSFLTAS